MIVCAGESEQFDFAIPVGIGLIDAAITLTKLCMEQKPESLLFIGTAGSYGEIGLLQIVESCSAANIENGFFNAGAYSPINNIVSCETMPDSPIVNSSNYITTDNSLAEAYREKNIQIENMEFYAIVKVAQKLGIPVKGIFCITNYCNKSAHKDFLANRTEAMQLLNKKLKKIKQEIKGV